MSSISDLARMLRKEKRTGSDYTAVVTRVEGQTAYVCLTGAEITNTPVRMSIDCKTGDRVRVRVSGGRAWITGNDTSPPTRNTEDINTLMKRMAAVEKLGSSSIQPKGSMGSHIGMIVHSTTLDTMEKVIDVYGGFMWIRHSGYMLRGADGGVSTANAVKDGGEETVKLTKEQSGLPAHGHTYTRPTVSSSGAITNGISGGGHTHAVKIHNNNTTGGSGARIGASSDTATVAAIASNTGTHTHNLPNHTHTLTGGGVANHTGADAAQAHNNMPPYKNVYIWERTA